MGMKKFLPINQHDIETALMGPNAAVAAMGTGVYRDTTVTRGRGLPKASRTTSWIMKMFSVLTFIGLIFGGTVAGFSFKMIGENQVGYYSDSGFMGPGTYFQFPWTKEEMKIVDISKKTMYIDNIEKKFDNGQFKFRIVEAFINYNVSNVDMYINTLKTKDVDVNVCEDSIKKRLRKEIDESIIYNTTTNTPRTMGSRCGGITIYNIMTTIERIDEIDERIDERIDDDEIDERIDDEIDERIDQITTERDEEREITTERDEEREITTERDEEEREITITTGRDEKVNKTYIIKSEDKLDANNMIYVDVDVETG